MLEFAMSTEDVERGAELIFRPLEAHLSQEEVLTLIRDPHFKKHIQEAIRSYLEQLEPEPEFVPMNKIPPTPIEQFEQVNEQLAKPSKKPKK